jgi:hypothetical protein
MVGLMDINLVRYIQEGLFKHASTTDITKRLVAKNKRLEKEEKERIKVRRIEREQRLIREVPAKKWIREEVTRRQANGERIYI